MQYDYHSTISKTVLLYKMPAMHIWDEQGYKHTSVWFEAA